MLEFAFRNSSSLSTLEQINSLSGSFVIWMRWRYFSSKNANVSSRFGVIGYSPSTQSLRRRVVSEKGLHYSTAMLEH